MFRVEGGESASPTPHSSVRTLIAPDQTQPPAEHTPASAGHETSAAPVRHGAAPRGRLEAHALAADVARRHSDALLRTARRVAVNVDDAYDAYQRGLELLIENAATIDRSKAVAWMHVVVRNEALRLRRTQAQAVPFDDHVHLPDAHRHSARADDRVDVIDKVRGAAEALETLKDSEAQALCLRAQGMSYREIAELCGWSYTKVNRAVTEGRRAFVDHYMAVERGEICDDVEPVIQRYAAGELRSRETLRVRAHLVRCTGCRALLHAHRGADHALRALLPPAVLAATPAGPTSWLGDQISAPFTAVITRLQPSLEPILGSKLGVAAASTLAVAGGGLAVERQVSNPAKAPHPINGAIIAPPPTTQAPAPPGGIRHVIDQSAGRTADLAARQRRAHERARARRAAARRAAARSDFAIAGGEFDPPANSAGTAARSARRASSGTAAPPAAPSPPPDVVTVDGEPDAGSTISVDTISEHFPR